MISQEQIPAVIDHPVYDSDGQKIGSARHIFYDDNTGYPEWVSVKTGMFGAETFVPIRDAHVVQDHLEVPYAKEKIKEAPAVAIDDAGHLSEQEEHRLHVYYGIVAGAAAGTARGAGGEAGTQKGKDTGAAMGRERPMGKHRGTMGRDREATAGTGDSTMAAGAAGAAGLGAAGAAGRGMGRERHSGAEGMLGREGIAADRGTARDGTMPSGAMAGAVSGQEAMTRSEEHMLVGTERHEVGRARLRKFVVTEEEQQTVPVRHEEVRIVREPITEANRDAALSGVEIGEAEHVVTLHAERPVVEMRTEPVERVRLTTEEVMEEQTVRGTCRKERIEADTIDMSEDTEPRHRR